MGDETTKEQAFANMDDFVQTNTDVAEDLQIDEGNQTTVESDDSTIPNSDKDLEVQAKEQPAEQGKTFSEKDVAIAITKANEKTQQNLELVVGLIKDNPEKLAELERTNPKLLEKLRNRAPHIFEDTVIENVKENSKYEGLLKQVLEQQESNEFNAWRESNRISQADYDSRANQFEEAARSLYDDGLCKTWKQALDVAGKVTFPHLDSSPVDDSTLKKIKGQAGNSSIATPSNDGDFDADDIRIMKKTGLSEQQYSNMQRGGEIKAPGIN